MYATISARVVLCDWAILGRARKKGSFGKGVFSEKSIILEILENHQTVENKVDSDQLLEMLENLEILEILKVPPVRRPLS